MASQNFFPEGSKRNSSRDELDFLSTKYSQAPVGENHFRSSFPFPDRPKPHLAPSLYSDDIVYNANTKNPASSHRRPYTRATRTGLVFRTADSTQKALHDLTQKRHETMEKRRAGMLLIGLLIFALCVHHVTDTGGPGAEVKILNSESKDVDVDVAVKSSESTETQPQADGDADGDTATTIQNSDKPVEEVIPEGKEFLEPIRHFAALSTPRRPEDTNFFFHIPRSGGQTIKEIVGRCLGKTLASEVGVRDGHGQDPTLRAVEINDAKYVNVDTTSVDGLHRAATLGLAESNLADMVSSSYFHSASMLFDLEHKGRAFTFLRNPLERVVSTYYDRTQGENADIDVSLEDYAQGNGIENNWVTRFLTNKMEGELTKEHLDQAKEIISTKFLIGMMDDSDESVKRLMKYFELSYDTDETRNMEQEDCIRELVKDGTNVNTIGYTLPKKGSQAYSLLTWQTQYDIKLYD